MKMNRILLMVIILGAAVAVRADSITIGLASLGTSADSGMGDDSLSVILNGNTLLLEALSSGNTYATCSDFGAGCLRSTQVTLDLKPYLKTGDNKLQFFVAQRAGSSFGLDYAGEIHDAVPEPATILMVGTGLAGLIATSWRITNQAKSSSKPSMSWTRR